MGRKMKSFGEDEMESKRELKLKQWKRENDFLFCYHKSSELSFLIKKMSWLCWENYAATTFACCWHFFEDVRARQSGKLNCWRHFEVPSKDDMHFALAMTCFRKSHNIKHKSRYIFSLQHISVWRRFRQIVVAPNIDSFEVERAFQVSIKMSETFSLQPT